MVTIKGMEIPDSRECTAFRVAKTTVRGEEGSESSMTRESWW